MQINVSAIQSACSSFLGTSYAGWAPWVRKRTFFSQKRAKRDVTGILGTGFRVVNSTDSEVLIKTLTTITSDLSKLRHSL